MKNGIDMLSGPLTEKIVLFALPVALTSIVQQLFIFPAGDGKTTIRKITDTFVTILLTFFQ